MIKLGKSKGITPVIAIVLLLLITVGAVGVLYTQFNNLVSGNNAQQQAQQLQQQQNSEYSIIGVERNDDSEYNVTLKNTGDVTLDLDNSSTMLVGVNGESPVASAVRGSECTPDYGRLSPGSTGECDTDITWEDSYNDDGRSTTFELEVGSSIKASYTCTESSGSDFC